MPSESLIKINEMKFNDYNHLIDRKNKLNIKKIKLDSDCCFSNIWGSWTHDKKPKRRFGSVYVYDHINRVYALTKDKEQLTLF